MWITVFFFVMQIANKDKVAQDVLTSEALYHISPMLDQLADGLQTSNMLEFRHFPELCRPLLVCSKALTAEDVSNALIIDTDSMKPEDEVTLLFLHRYLQKANEKGVLMVHVVNSLGTVLALIIRSQK